MSSRLSKPPAKFDDCVTGGEIDNAIKNNENPLIHKQSDGRTNNVTFKTEHTEVWKNVLLSHFGNDASHLIKDGGNPSVIKVTPTDESGTVFQIKINIYKTGSIVIQGAKCAKFEEKYFQILKDEVVKIVQEAQPNCNPQNQINVNQTTASLKEKPDEEATIPKTLDDSSLTLHLDPEMTVIEQKDNICNSPSSMHNNKQFTSTPVSKKSTLTPKAKVAHHQETLHSNLDSIFTVLETVDTALVSIVGIVSDIKHAVNDFDNLSSKSENQLKTFTKHIKEQLSTIESKIKHNNTSIESLHVKSNSLDKQVKDLNINQIKIMDKLDIIQKSVLSHREEQEDSITELKEKFHTFETQIIKEHDKHKKVKPNVQDETAFSLNNILDKPKDINNNDQSIDSSQIHPGDDTKPETDIDNLILGDSIIRRIQARRFNPYESTVINYINGGADSCIEYVQEAGYKLNPKKVLVNIGGRDLRGDGVKEDKFKELFSEITRTWPKSQIYVLPILKRKDIPYDKVQMANQTILSASQGFKTIRTLDPFVPADNMYFDHVHLNTTKGIPSLVKFLKKGMNITPSITNSSQPYKSTTRQRDQPNQTTRRYDHQYNQYSTHEDRLTNERYKNYNNNRVNNIQLQPEFPQSPRFPQSQPFNMNNSQERPPFPQPQQFNMNTSQRQPFPQTTTFNMNNNLHRTPFLQAPPVNLPPLPFYPWPWGQFNQPSNQNGFSNYP